MIRTHESKKLRYLLGITALVGVILDGGFLVSLLEIILGSVLRYSQDLVVPRVVALLRRPPKHPRNLLLRLSLSLSLAETGT